MKEIDFLPQWYKSGRQRQFSYRTQYVALAGIFVVMVVWNFITAHSISRAGAELTQMQASQAGAEGASAKLARVKGELADLQKKVKYIEEIDSRIDVASVLAEMSFLIDERIVLSKIQFIAERFEDKQQATPGSGFAVRVAEASMRGKGSLPLGDVRFKVVINGIAADAGDVAALVCKLEDSPYFCNVIPLFSRNKQVQRGANSAERGLRGESLGLSYNRNVSKSADIFQVSGFEISCYLANYRARLGEGPAVAPEG